jgi:tRNA G37 N-methylase TrmD
VLLSGHHARIAQWRRQQSRSRADAARSQPAATDRHRGAGDPLP